MRPSILMVGLIVGTLALGALFSRHALAEKYEEPPYEVVQSHVDWEIRKYAPAIEARVSVDGPYDQAVNNGFRLLAGYIFGKNEPNESIAMTVPVAARPTEGQQIAMTTPVSTTPNTPDTVGAVQTWTIAFTMPDQWSLDTLPAPLDDRVQLVETSEQLWAVLRFSGKANARTAEKNRQVLLSALAVEGLQPSGEPVIAQYNPPWIPGFLRRNEVKIPLGPTMPDTTTPPESPDV